METIGQFKASACRLPARSYGVVEFDMPPDRLAAPVEAGHGATTAFVRALPGG